jgi:hypothetical protein
LVIAGKVESGKHGGVAADEGGEIGGCVHAYAIAEIDVD